MHDQIGGTPLAVRDPATGRAGKDGGVAAPVKENQTLLSSLQTVADGGQKRLGYAFLQLDLAGVEDPYRGQLCLRIGPLQQEMSPVAAILRVGPAFQRWRGRAEQDGDVLLAGAYDGQIARGVTHAVLLLEGGIVFFIDQKQSEAWQRREYGEAGAEDDISFAAQGL